MACHTATLTRRSQYQCLVSSACFTARAATNLHIFFPEMSDGQQYGRQEEIESQGNRAVIPFSIRILAGENEQSADVARRDHDEWLLSLLPASYRQESRKLVAAGQHVTACLEGELDLRRLTSIRGWLWVAGLPLPPRPLHHQLLLGREIFVTEQMDMHLIWTTGRMFLKPVPRFLLEPAFWAKYLCCAHSYDCSPGNDVVQRGTKRTCLRLGLRQRALGFLFSYAALISHESDFCIAQEKHLLPQEARWPAWRMLVDQLDAEHIHPNIDPRFHHGELRLSRLNKIYALSQTPFRGYMTRWNQYSTFFQDHFAWLASATVYIAIVLTAMQVGLTTKNLSSNDAFQSASYVFTVFAILGPLSVALLIVLVFCCIFVYNWVRAINANKRHLGSGMSRQ
ncbi:uncharacterized protein MAM_07340 [Metarhizium album ARSEF 1941]|uniref:Subtilisin-like serine protease n=1 Tax=Metarhizium album (strain ARSEF 1941) TaxID=1081103 RepID=A0A0B2WM80_METAS|nr:uncharacterized protein MAM_07340 [Metarhizium album ARSEF 1941]KHN94744.1 hypothetical protein MAM_07340 [Metarhizium album ARSEF 1941]